MPIATFIAELQCVEMRYLINHFRAFPDSCDSGCRFGPVHQRMLEAHKHWHEAQENYGDPVLFRVGLNACIQALRNVTFVLQKHKAIIPCFDGWYPGWQQRMKNDRMTRWLVDARNLIVKQGDLTTNSVALISVADSYLNPRGLGVPTPADPFTPIEVMAKTAIWSNPKNVKVDGYLRVERRWIANDLPEIELLEVLSYCYEQLTQLVTDLHRQTNTGSDDRHLVKPRCMLVSEDDRAIVVNLKDYHTIKLCSSNRPPDDRQIGEARERYGEINPGIPDFRSAGLREIANGLLQYAVAIFRKDGCHAMTAWLRKSDGVPHLLAFHHPYDRPDKFLIARQIAREVKHYKADMLFVISEIWVTSFDPESSGRGAVESPNREEMLSVSAIAQSGETVTLAAKVVRDGAGAHLGETNILSDVEDYFFCPVREVWNKSE